ncbi:head maturation protease, ClpP-related [Lactococcus lactis]|uniref:head maturation protease, ClpP-related n=1 Tax=Lactococcus lactis TaxID=1358 RepID=UPI00223AC48C|nr:head maturation protease, ClpP-related [Lactococcus lactis]
MKTLKFNGSVIDNSNAWLYDWLEMDYISPKVVDDFLKDANGESVAIQINSGGGSVFAGSEIFTALGNYPGEVNVEITGICASAATFPLLAADYVSITPIGQVMIHNVSSIQVGDYRDMDSTAKALLGASGNLAELYAKKMNISSEEARSLMDAETWYNAKQAKEAGLVNEVLFDNNEPVKLVAGVGPMLSPEKINQLKNMIKDSENKSQGSPSLTVELDADQMNSITNLIDEKISAVKAEFEANNSADKPLKNQLFKFGGIK